VDHLARAEALLTATPLVDGHNDLPWALRCCAGDVADADLAGGMPALHTDLPRLRAGRVGMQFWSVYVPCSFTGSDAVAAVLEQVDLVHRLTEGHPADLGLATTADAAEAAFAAGRVASLLGAEGGHAIGARSACCGRCAAWACAT
jgi:membrane dipeptidase